MTDNTTTMMDHISHFGLHYGLLLLGTGGVVEILRVLGIARRDMQALLKEGLNGPRREAVLSRIYSCCFLLAVFAVLLNTGRRIAVAHEAELDAPLVLSLIIAFESVAMLLLVKEYMVRRSRLKLDSYFDEMFPKPKVHLHRRHNDPPVSGERDGH